MDAGLDPSLSKLGAKRLPLGARGKQEDGEMVRAALLAFADTLGGFATAMNLPPAVARRSPRLDDERASPARDSGCASRELRRTPHV